ncbi:MAG: UvrD-helicase domain-containing protein [Bacteroidetes bacterium]|nr:UvrD-helicase domain-containing protein [Bacteroidota bacterium]MBL6943786.1 UvrD-helicase domain-containing protein [Bacteroidales bacterium]
MPLIVYKSSAGSGKTTTLVNEYLKIALKQPESFRHILAITFTNKAANEMKSRVIETLKNLSDASKEPDQKLSNLISAINVDMVTLRNRAQKLLSLILHNYDEFAISTIDSFIHRVIRTFATDVQLPQNFEVVIDDEDIIPDIIQLLYDKIGNNKELTKVIINFVLAQADEEKGYDPTFKLIAFIKHHMSEDGFQHISKLNNLNIGELGDIIIRLRNKIEIEKSQIIKFAGSAIELCEANNLEIKDFYQGNNGILGYFVKLQKFNVPDEKLFPGKRVQETIEEEKWFSSKTTPAIQQSISAIKPNLSDYYQKVLKLIGSYFFHRLIYSKIYSLALVHEIRNLFAEFTEQTGKVHISEFNKKISNEIAGQPVPFIYERLGRKYRYFLIDEFQDTSVLQWHNLLPLIEESLSYGNFNMLVGDAKQAIYRFRNGEVELFSNLPDLYDNDGSQLSLTRQNLLHREYEEVILSTNWRSYSEIIKFNNDFFKTVVEPLSERTKLIYQELKQNIPEKSKAGGLVSLNFVAEDDAEIYEQEKLSNINDFVVKLRNIGFKEKDICILCRTKKSAISIAGFLLEKRYNVVSSESLLLTNSPKVRLIIAFFKLLNYPNDELAIAEFVENHIVISPDAGSFDDEFRSIRNNSKPGINKIFDHFKIVAKPNELHALSTYEIAEFVFKNIIKQNTADVFIQFLLDFILETNLPLDKFISRWEDKKEKLFISMPEDINAIRIMTIHKAKGLDFPAVIVDAANIKNPNTKNEYWEDLQHTGFEDLKVGLFPLTKNIQHINKGHIYDEEVAKTELDFLNLIYVAFTRPIKALFAIGQIKSRNPKDKFSDYMMNYLVAKGLWQDNKLAYNFGELSFEEFDDKKSPHEIIKLNTFISSKWQDLISVALSEDISQEVFTGISSKSYGKLIHKILAEIKTADDITSTINTLISFGLFNINDIKIIETTITDVVTHPDLKKYYEKELIIKNETELLLNNGEIVRPDRVVINKQLFTIIDYKTGEEKDEDYHQLRKYSEAFSALGYKTIESKIVYIGDIIRIVDVR